MKLFIKQNIKYIVVFLLGILAFAVMLFPTSGETLWFISEFANRVVGGLFSLVPFSLMTVFILLVPVFVGLFVWRILVNAKRKTLKKFWLNVLVAVCIFYIWFASLLGLNYRKASIYDKMGLADVAVTSTAVAQTTTAMVEILNETVKEIEFDGLDRNLVLPDGYDKEYITKIVNEAIEKQDLNFLYDFGAKAKYTFVPGILSWMDFDGVYFPLFAELNIDSSVSDENLAVLLTHETIHSKGILNEEQTEFLAQYICVNSDDPVLRYSGAYTASIYLFRELRTIDSKLCQSKLALIEDEYLRERISYFTFRTNDDTGFFTDVATFFYDLYLRLNFVDGADAYDGCINGWVRYCYTPTPLN